VVGTSLELTLYTESGRFLDRISLSPEQLPVPAHAMVGLVGTLVRTVKDPPGG
jgi:hypothetical protein